MKDLMDMKSLPKLGQTKRSKRGKWSPSDTKIPLDSQGKPIYGRPLAGDIKIAKGKAVIEDKVKDVMPVEKAGSELDARRRIVFCHRFSQLLSGGDVGLQVVAFQELEWYVNGLAKGCDVDVTASFVDFGDHGVVIVIHDEKHAKAMRTRKDERLIKGTFLHRAVACYSAHDTRAGADCPCEGQSAGY